MWTVTTAATGTPTPTAATVSVAASLWRGDCFRCRAVTQRVPERPERGEDDAGDGAEPAAFLRCPVAPAGAPADDGDLRRGHGSPVRRLRHTVQQVRQLRGQAVSACLLPVAACLHLGQRSPQIPCGLPDTLGTAPIRRHDRPPLLAFLVETTKPGVCAQSQWPSC